MNFALTPDGQVCDALTYTGSKVICHQCHKVAELTRKTFFAAAKFIHVRENFRCPFFYKLQTTDKLRPVDTSLMVATKESRFQMCADISNSARVSFAKNWHQQWKNATLHLQGFSDITQYGTQSEAAEPCTVIEFRNTIPHTKSSPGKPVTQTVKIFLICASQLYTYKRFTENLLFFQGDIDDACFRSDAQVLIQCSNGQIYRAMCDQKLKIESYFSYLEHCN